MCQVWAYLRVGLSERDSQIRRPGSVRPSMVPVLGQVAVMHFAGVQLHVSEEALVAPDQRGGNEGRGKLHVLTGTMRGENADMSEHE